MSAIVSPEWVSQRLTEDPDRTVIVDVRFHLTKPEEGREAYLKGHLPGAVYIDLEQDLSGDAGKHGGRHPLPAPEHMSKKLGAVGIDHRTTVVVYDAHGGMFAARFWWQLRYLGHDSVYVLDGGLTNWVKKGYDLTSDIPRPVPREFVPKLQKEELLDAKQVKDRIGRTGSVLIDARERARYAGETEPLDHKAGHIPGAKNYFWKGNFREDGKWKNPEELKEHYVLLDRDSEIIVYCGSGVSACPNVLGLKEAGFQRVKLYAGSWSDWISYTENPVATGEE
ncbi:sulfurtransferase [Bacillus sonorensis]|uniref:Thiosulfate sulfurtransferase n=2 Tax=Bacillus sonorensis TaxID=119858 RepID=M5PCC1_9BACI|nr:MULTISPECIES: sulfurtransferase [Bacillus]TWK73880.1 putative thiosulfate sulfurtransferase SseB [Bacillus paralicheniformis]ASB91187.1 Thiosulfate sulfurtransferase [Bacillus sonorensis]EME72772.1 thiosulfate sulfurtransferase [Bacillus sonorensis L12]MCZ0074119.1 sulfurtransferase [Bacillus sonorensis]MCZ0092741.1 sulfurtransferase [Bacillus sonorensis]